MDDIGNLLRDFYALYGVADEGPPTGLNVSALVSADFIPSQDIELLRDALTNQVLQRQFLSCRRLVDDLANRLTSEEFLREISALPLISIQQFESLENGVYWFALANSLDRRDGNTLVTPFDKQLDLPFQVKIRMTVEGSLILQLYLALVYMREGVLADLIKQGAQSGKPCCVQIRKLLNSDYVRQIRNALSHGTFSSCIAGIAFRDEHNIVVATPGYLRWLSSWLFLIQYQSLMASNSG